MKGTLLSVLAIGAVIAVAVTVHLVASVIDWPWAIAMGAAAAIILRALIGSRSTDGTPHHETPLRS
jgi:hypothetical protein